MSKYECPCDYVYDPAEGDYDNGIEAGTAFEDLPDGWVCPLCGAEKEFFDGARRMQKGGQRFGIMNVDGLFPQCLFPAHNRRGHVIDHFNIFQSGGGVKNGFG